MHSFPWQQQTHNYRYIISYKPKRALGQEREVHLLTALSQAQEAAPTEAQGDAFSLAKLQSPWLSGSLGSEPVTPSTAPVCLPYCLSGGRRIKHSREFNYQTSHREEETEQPWFSPARTELCKGGEGERTGKRSSKLGLLPPYSLLFKLPIHQVVRHCLGLTKTEICLFRCRRTNLIVSYPTSSALVHWAGKSVPWKDEEVHTGKERLRDLVIG